MTGSHRRLWRLLALLFAFSLVAAACGGGDDDDAGDGTTDAGTQTADEDMADDEAMADEEEMADEAEPEDESSIGGGITQEALEDDAAEDEGDMADEDMADDGMMSVNIDDFDLSTIDGIWELAAAQRAAIVSNLTAGIEAGDYGVGSDGILRGPSGFEIDMNECPSDWSDTTGITDTEIRIGQTTVKSGNLAAYGDITVGWENYYEYVNATGGVAGKEMVLISRDDGYVAAQTIEFVDELIESENVFALHTLGSPNTLAVYDQINDECIPQVMVATGHPAWGDPVNHPWTTGLQMSYSTEAILWGNWIKENLADELPVKVAGLVMDNDFGLAYELGFEAYAHANPDVVSEFIPVRHDPAAPTLTNEVTTIAAASPNVFISMTAGNPCLLAIQEVDASGLLDDLSVAFTPSVCKAVAAYMAPAGDSSDDWWIVGGGVKDTTDPKHVDEPFISFLRNELADRGLDPEISLLGTGYYFAYPHTEAIRVAAELPGGLTRTNFILAARSLDIYHPLLLDGISFAADGAVDGYYVEGSDFSQYDATEQTWNIVGDIVDVNGGSPNCAWDKDNGGCR
ncbi:ABC transporter substrate-binding protein [Candidatus Poriferisodalis sp.]|uniref:ABC transporter substrate-binding protein n=1 Tax=Candidatus Poriferisodalis sp. TaxID=3101277 RepID=UPI003B02B903